MGSQSQESKERAFDLALEIEEELGDEIHSGVAAIRELPTDQPLTYDKGLGAFVDRKATDILEIIERKEKMMNTIPFQNSVLNHLKNRNWHSILEFDSPRYLAFKNTILDLDTWEIVNFSPRYLIRTQFPLVLNPKARCPNILAFLKELQPDPVVRGHILESIASCFDRTPKKRQIDFFIGEPDTGKTTLLNLILVFFGSENVSNKTLAQLGGADKYALAGLYRKVVNISSEMKEQTIVDTEVIKSITGGDRVDAQHKYGQPFQYYPYLKYFFAANNFPHIDFEKNPDIMADMAYWGRFKVTKFEIPIPSERRDDTLVYTNREDQEKGKLTNSLELSGLLNLVLPILRRIHFTGKTHYLPTPIETRELWINNADWVRQFLNDTVLKDPKGFVLVSALWKLAQTWRIQPEHEYSFISNHDFNSRVTNYGALQTEGKDGRKRTIKIWRGIRLKTEVIHTKGEMYESNVYGELSTESTDFQYNLSYRLDRYSRESSQKSVDMVDMVMASPKNGSKNELASFLNNPLYHIPKCPICSRTFKTTEGLATHFKIVGGFENHKKNHSSDLSGGVSP